MLRHALTYGVVIGLGPIQTGLALAMLHPILESATWWWVFYVGFCVHLSVLAADFASRSASPRPLKELWANLYLKPLLALGLIHLLFVLLFCSRRELGALVDAVHAKPSVKVRSDELRPPPHGPPRSAMQVFKAALSLVAKLFRSAFVFFIRIWIGSPIWPALAVMVVAALRYKERTA